MATLLPVVCTAYVTQADDVIEITGLDASTGLAAVLTDLNCRPNSTVFLAGIGYVVKARVDTTHFRVERDYAGDTSVDPDPGVSCTISPFTPEMANRSELAAHLREYIQLAGLIENTGIGIDAFGTLAGRDTFDDVYLAADGLPFVYLALTYAGPDVASAAYYLKNSPDAGDWTGPVPLQGPTGPRGSGLAYDAQADNMAGRAAYDAEAEGFAVLVSDTGDGRAAIYVMGNGGAGDWGAAAYVTPVNGMPGTAGAPGYLDFYEQTTNGVNKGRLQAPAALAADRVWTLPDANFTMSVFMAGLMASASAAALQAAAGVREKVAANRTLYVGYDLGTVTMSVGSPAVVGKVGHGLAVDSRVSFAVLENKKACTISIGNPSVATMANTFVAGQPVKFSTTGRLPGGVTAGTTYYVLAAGLSGASFQYSDTPGGAPIATTAPTVTVTIASPGVCTAVGHGMVVGQPVKLATTGALPTGITAGVVVFVKTAPTADTFTVADYPEAAAINTSGGQSGTHTLVDFGNHYCAEAGALPTGVTQGQNYWVIAAGLTADQFQFAATQGGAAIITSGSTEGLIACRTGSDSNDGLSQTRAGALLTIAAGITKMAAYDMSVFDGFIYVARGQYNEGITLKQCLGAGFMNLIGDNVTPSNVVINAAGAGSALRCDNVRNWIVKGFKLQTSTAFHHCIYCTRGGDLNLDSSKFELGDHVATGHWMLVDMPGSRISAISAEFLVSGLPTGGTGGFVLGGSSKGLLDVRLTTVRLLNLLPAGTYYAASLGQAQVVANNLTRDGYSLGVRYSAQSLAFLTTGGGGAQYFPGASAGAVTSGAQYQ